MRSVSATVGSTLLVLLLLSALFFPLRLISLVPEYAVTSTEMHVHIDYGDLGTESEMVNDDSVATSTLYIVGDVMLGRHVEYLMGKHGYAYPYEQVGFFIDKPAYVLANFEAAIPVVHKKTPNFGFTFSVASAAVPALRTAGVSHVSLANNHSYDYGQVGYEHTVNTLRAAGIASFGLPTGLASSSYTVIDLGDTTLGVLGLHTLTSVPDKDAIEVSLSELEELSDIQLVYIHWGTEYVQQPNTAQRDLVELLSKSGADLIVGHHPHVVQSVERVGTALVFYSLGNFIFDQYFSDEVQEGLVLKIDTQSRDALSISLLPVSSKTSQAQPRPMDYLEREAFLSQLTLISQESLAEDIISGQFMLVRELATSTEIAIMDQ